MPESSTDSSPKTRKSRSPNYPSVDLETAVAKCRTLFPLIGRHKATPADVMKELGYSVKSSSGIQMVGALAGYGLLNSEGRGEERRLSLSKGAVIILHGEEDTQERLDALQAAAVAPPAHAALWDKFGSELPQSDQVIRSFLIVDLRFTEDAATQLISEYRSTFGYAELDSSPPTENNDDSDTVEEITIGSLIQWIVDGTKCFPEGPREVLRIEESNGDKFCIVMQPDGKEGGLPMSQAVLEKPDAGDTGAVSTLTPLMIPGLTPPASHQHGKSSDAQFFEDKFSIGDQELYLRAPQSLSTDEFEDISDFLELYKRKLKRRIHLGNRED